MGQEIGKIVKISGGEATVRLNGGKHCSTCAAKSLCSLGAPGSESRFLKMPAASAFREGAAVQLEYRESSRIISALIVFLLPLLFLFTGYALANHLFDFANRQIVGAVIGFAFSGIVLFGLNEVLSSSGFVRPRITPAVGGGAKYQPQSERS